MNLNVMIEVSAMKACRETEGQREIVQWMRIVRIGLEGDSWFGVCKSIKFECNSNGILPHIHQIFKDNKYSAVSLVFVSAENFKNDIQIDAFSFLMSEPIVHNEFIGLAEIGRYWHM